MPPRRSSRLAARTTAAAVPAPAKIAKAVVKRQKNGKAANCKLAEPTGKTNLSKRSVGNGEVVPKRTAANEFWRTEELRAVVLGLVDRWTLMGMMRLEKGSVASAASVLYNSVHITQAIRMNRKTPRSRIYCNAVRTLDRNPFPIDVLTLERETFANRWSELPEVKGTTLNPKRILHSVATWRKKFHDLLHILNDNPAKASDSSYRLVIRGRAISIHLETKVDLDLSDHSLHPSATTAATFLPLPQLLPGFLVHQTIRLDVTRGHIRYWLPAGADLMYQWKEWLYLGPHLDRRVNSVRSQIKLSFEDVRVFLRNRISRKCEPIQRFIIDGDYSFAEIEELLLLLGSHLRYLRIEHGITAQEVCWLDLLSLINQHNPLLESLEISLDHRQTLTRPSAVFANILPNLRCFTFRSIWGQYPVCLMLYLSRIGSTRCVYAPKGLYGELVPMAVGKMANKMRSYDPSNAYLHTIDFFTLDVLGLNDLPHLLAGPPSQGRLRRAAWNMIEDLQVSLGRHAHLCEERGVRRCLREGALEGALIEAQRCCSEVLAELEDAQGEKDQEDAALRRHFKELRATWGWGEPAYKVVGSLSEEVREKALGVMEYAEAWLREHYQRSRGIAVGRCFSVESVD